MKTKVFDIRLRNRKFTVETTKFVLLVKKVHHYEIASQLLRSASSVGASLAESLAARSRKESVSIFNFALRECRETFYWFGVVEDLKICPQDHLDYLKEELNEITSIIIAMIKKTSRS